MSLPSRRFCPPLPAQWLPGALCGLVIFMGLLVSEAGACPRQHPVLTVKFNGVQLRLEIAATPEERKCGLSGRSELPPDSGMLFVLPETMPFAVWMKDTRLPLSVAFLDATGRIVAIEQMAPLRTDVIYDSQQPVRYALEVNQGWFSEHGVKVGDVLNLTLPTGLRVH